MEQDYQFAELWREAFTIYKKRTGRDLLLEISKYPSLQSVEGLQRMIEQTDKNFNAFRHRHALWDYLRVVMKPVQLFAGLTQAGISVTPFAPGKFFFHLAHRLTKASLMSLGNVPHPSISATFSNTITMNSGPELDEMAKKTVHHISCNSNVPSNLSSRP